MSPAGAGYNGRVNRHCFLSPHLDDAVYSCGAWIAHLAASGHQVLVLTLCAGDAPPGPLSSFAASLHRRWDLGLDAVDRRRREDRRACRHLGVRWQHMELPEAVYRRGGGRALYRSEEGIFGPLAASDLGRLAELGAAIQRAAAGAALYVPLAVGGHVDHRLARMAAEGMGRPLRYYADLPYALRGYQAPEDLPPPPGQWQVTPVSEAALDRWLEAVWMYRSQRSTFWQTRREMEAEFTRALRAWGGMKWYAAEMR